MRLRDGLTKNAIGDACLTRIGIICTFADEHKKLTARRDGRGHSYRHTFFRAHNLGLPTPGNRKPTSNHSHHEAKKFVKPCPSPFLEQREVKGSQQDVDRQISRMITVGGKQPTTVRAAVDDSWSTRGWYVSGPQVGPPEWLRVRGNIASLVYPPSPSTEVLVSPIAKLLTLVCSENVLNLDLFGKRKEPTSLCCLRSDWRETST